MLKRAAIMSVMSSNALCDPQLCLNVLLGPELAVTHYLG